MTQDTSRTPRHERTSVILALTYAEYQTIRLLVESHRARRRLSGDPPSPSVEQVHAALEQAVRG
jgi:hypothetical protein